MKKADIKASSDTIIVEPLDGEEKVGSLYVSAAARQVRRGRILSSGEIAMRQVQRMQFEEPRHPDEAIDDDITIGDTVFYLPWNVHENSPHNTSMGDAANSLVEWDCEDGKIAFVGYSRVLGYAKAVPA